MLAIIIRKYIMLFNGFRGEHYMENKELSININEDKLKIAKQKTKIRQTINLFMLVFQQ